QAEQFRQVMDVNVVAPLLLTQLFVPHLSATGGSVVNIASMAAKVPTPGTGAYSPSKAALVSLTKLCAVEFAHTGVRFNAVAPGGVRTEGTAQVSADPEREARFNALVPLGRRALPEDIADVVSFFASADARYVTGQVLYVDGGLTEGTVTSLQAAQNAGGSGFSRLPVARFATASPTGSRGLRPPATRLPSRRSPPGRRGSAPRSRHPPGRPRPAASRHASPRCDDPCRSGVAPPSAGDGRARGPPRWSRPG